MSPLVEIAERAWRTLLAAVTAAALIVATMLTASPASADEAPLPDVIPSIEGWEPATGVFTAPDDLAIVADGSDAKLHSTAEILRSELAVGHPGVRTVSAHDGPGAIELRVDADRDDLGAQGYDLEIGESIVITGADPAGTFNGTRTVLQMLMQQSTLPRGSLVDVPEYPERGVTVCACVINISPEFMDRLVEDMALLKMNTLMVELKVKVDDHPETNSWSYYTKDDVRALVEKAEKYGIEVIPEINSPGHMEIWLDNKPDLQLTNEATGAKDEVRMDITKPESFEFYTDLIDEYSDVFTSSSWHMGVDEYMLGSGYKNFPQIKRFAEQEFGEGATENDVVAWYVNKVNDYVKSQGKSLRIWNDGVMTTNEFVPFDSDIVVEHWNQAGSTVTPQQFIDQGHRINNISNSLYMVRDGYGVDAKGLYEGGWTPQQFHGQKVTEGADRILGARMSIWPDAGTPQEAENTTEQRMFEPLRFVAQTTWTNDRPWSDYAGFEDAMKTIGRSPTWDRVERQPLPSGAFDLSADGRGIVAGDGSSVELGANGDTFSFERTDDGYYRIRATDGRCLDLSRSGTMRLNVPVDIGADVTLAACDATTLQKWQVREVDGGYTVANAASQQFLSISAGLTDVPVAGEGFRDIADGRVVQTPADWGRTVWTAAGDVSLAIAPDDLSAPLGGSSTMTVTVGNMTEEPVDDASLRVTAPEGWTVVPSSRELGDLAPGASTDIEVTAHNIRATSGAVGVLGVELVDGSGEVVARAEAPTTGACTTDTIRPTDVPEVSSEQPSGEPAPSGPAAAAIDGDPATYWHTQWSPTTPEPPHAIVLDLGEAQDVCGLSYTGRSSTGAGGANGRIGDYEVYASTSAVGIDGDWGDPVAEGTFESSADPQLASFAPQSARYLKLVAVSEVNGNPWATAGELAGAGPAPEPTAYDPAIELGSAGARAGDDLAVSGSGFAPGEGVEISLTKSGPGTSAVLGTLEADGEGRIDGRVTVPEESKGGPHEVTATGAVTDASASASLKLKGAKG